MHYPESPKVSSYSPKKYCARNVFAVMKTMTTAVVNQNIIRRPTKSPK